MIPFLSFQNADAEKFETNPIIFGDFMKIGAEPEDRMYEELSNLTKLKQILADVSMSRSRSSPHNSCLLSLNIADLSLEKLLKRILGVLGLKFGRGLMP